MILLDSSVLIELFRKKDKKKTLFYRLSRSRNDMCISVITYYEIGIGNSPTHTEYWNRLCENLTIIPLDRQCADDAVSIYTDLRKRNKMIDLADLLIGATALSKDIPLATLNLKHFERIKGLDIYK